MGNCTSCIYVGVQTQTAKLIDFHGNLRQVKVPITAAELMLEEPHHFVSSVEDIRRTRRFHAVKADEELFSAKVYMLVPANRVNCLLSESEMTTIESACEKRPAKRRSSKILPSAIEDGDKNENCKDTGLVMGLDTCASGYRLRQWRPALEPISEGFSETFLPSL